MAPRKTRAAAKAQETTSSTDTLEIPSGQEDQTAEDERYLDQEEAEEEEQEEGQELPIAEDMSKTKGGKKCKKGGKKKGKKAKADSPTTTTAPIMSGIIADAIPAPADIEDGEFNAAAMPVLRSPKKEMEPEAVEEPAADARPEYTEAKPVRMTRRQLALAENAQEATPATTLTVEDPVEDSPTEAEPVASKEEAILAVKVAEEIDVSAGETAAAVSEVATDTVEKDVAEDTTAVASPPSTDAFPERPNLQPLSTSLSHSSSLSQIQSEHPIEALDALEDAIDAVSKIVPGLDSPISPTQPHPTRSTALKTKPSGQRTTKAPSPSTSKSSIDKKTPAEKAGPKLDRSASVKTRAAPKLASTTQPSATSRIRVTGSSITNGTNLLSRSTSVKTTNPLAKSTSTLARSTSMRSRPSSMIVAKADTLLGSETKKPDYLAAKRRPISVQFPTPPPPPKSSKPPTQATFKLPGEDVAAKLKQAKEERLKRMEAAAVEKKEAKARPGPAIRKPAEVKPAARMARLSTAGVDPAKGKENMTHGGLKRSPTVADTSSNTAKRASAILDRTKRASVIRSAPNPSIQPPKRSSLAAENDQKAFSSSLSVPKRTATAAPSANTSAKRLSSVASSTSLGSKSRNVSGASGPTASIKGKEVFNRDQKSSLTLEKEKREKDDALKKARADAAERGRQASREWAEKQKKAKAVKEAVVSERVENDVVAV